MDYEANADVLRVVTPGTDLVLDTERYAIPEWALPLSIDDNAQLHERLFRSVAGIEWSEDRQAIDACLIGLVETCWQRRFPVDGAPIFRLLKAHGVSSSLRNDFIEHFDFGMRLLTGIHGRAPIKKKQVPPMSKGRYLTKAHQEFVMRLRRGIGSKDV